MTTTPTEVIRTDGVTVLPDDLGGRNTWTVEAGTDFLGVIWDEGDKLTRGRYSIWATHDSTARFFHHAADAVEAIVQAWPTTAAAIATDTGAPVAAVLETAAAVDAEYRSAGGRAVLRIASAQGPDTKITRQAAAEIARRLTPEPTPAAPTPDAAPEWRTLKGVTTPCRIWGEERTHGFRTAGDRKRVTGEPLVITRLWFDGVVRLGEDENGREIYLGGAATRVWVAPAPTDAPAVLAPSAPAAAPEWRTLKGVQVPFQLYGTENEQRFYPAGNRTKQATGEPLTITRTWFANGGYHAEDETGREISLHGAAAKYWIVPGPATTPTPTAPAATPEWRTLAGVQAPFQVYGRRIGNGLITSTDRKQATGEPVAITYLWTHRGARYGVDADGRELYLGKPAAKFWVVPGPTC